MKKGAPPGAKVGGVIWLIKKVRSRQKRNAGAVFFRARVIAGALRREGLFSSKSRRYANSKSTNVAVIGFVSIPSANGMK